MGLTQLEVSQLEDRNKGRMDAMNARAAEHLGDGISIAFAGVHEDYVVRLLEKMLTPDELLDVRRDHQFWIARMIDEQEGQIDEAIRKATARKNLLLPDGVG